MSDPHRAADGAAVSVVTTAYNHADYVLASVESVLAQRPAPLELIVVDDGSPDDTAERLAPAVAAGRVRYVRQANAGMAAARNAGAALARGEYLMFVDDDDVLYPDALRLLLAEMERHPDAALVSGEEVEFVGEPAPRPEDAPHASPLDPDRFLVWNQIKSPGQVLVRRRAFEAVGGYDATFWGADDWDLWQRLLARYPGRRISSPVLAYRLHGGNASRDIARMYRSVLAVARTHVGRVPPARRAAARYASYALLRHKHVGQLVGQVRREARAGAWRRAVAAAGALTLALGLDLGARVGLKAHLARRGRWHLAPDDPYIR